MNSKNIIVEKIKNTVIEASSVFREDKKEAYRDAISRETSPAAKWVLETILENALVAEENKSPMCDDTGIPHLLVEIGSQRSVNGEFFSWIKEGVKEGLMELPGRPMAILGDDIERIEQSRGLSSKSEDVLTAPMIIKDIEGDKINVHILMQGGGPAIRGKTYRVFHKHKIENVVNEIIEWSTEAVSQLGCTPCTLAIGIGRSQLEATALMTEAQIYGKHSIQSEIEKEITDKVNLSKVGALGLGGDISVLGTFIKTGPQRASGVRVVCIRPCCCFEPRLATAIL